MCNALFRTDWCNDGVHMTEDILVEPYKLCPQCKDFIITTFGYEDISYGVFATALGMKPKRIFFLTHHCPKCMSLDFELMTPVFKIKYKMVFS